ncbi:MAG: hypothetical protein ABFD10_23220 [Prolixibacteraceae bacterium]
MRKSRCHLRFSSILLRSAFLLFLTAVCFSQPAAAQSLMAGTGKKNITADSGEVHDSLYVKALVIESQKIRIALITLDVVAIGTIGDIPDEFLMNVRKRVKNELKIDHVLVNASHNHLDGFLNGGKKIAEDVEGRTIMAVKKALMNMEPVKAGAGKGFENRFAMNRRIKLKSGEVFTIRHANPNMPDDEIAQVGEFDPEIGILRIDRLDGTPKALVYNYACHPYTGVPDKGVTAEFPGFASGIIEEQLGHGAMAFFLQGAAGDITEVLYKDTNNPRDSEPFGQMLALSTLKATRKITAVTTNHLSLISETVKLPLRTDIPDWLKRLEKAEAELLDSLRFTNLNLKVFIPLYIQYNISPDYPSYYAYRYLQEEKTGLNGLKKMDEENQKDIGKYLSNIHVMEKLAQIQVNKEMLKQKQDEINEYGGKFVSAEIMGVRIGDFVIVTLPAEAFVQVGIKIKAESPYANTVFSGYTNGYLHYAPTARSYHEGGYEIMNCILAPCWQKIYENKIHEIIGKL